jgi:hypothetical protein
VSVAGVGEQRDELVAIQPDQLQHRVQLAPGGGQRDRERLGLGDHAIERGQRRSELGQNRRQAQERRLQLGRQAVNLVQRRSQQRRCREQRAQRGGRPTGGPVGGLHRRAQIGQD